jgi:hypothetical protein
MLQILNVSAFDKTPLPQDDFHAFGSRRVDQLPPPVA